MKIFEGLKKPKSLKQYNYQKGITDFTNPAQWDLYEGGYSFLMVCSIPKFLEVLGQQNSDIQDLMDCYVYTLEHEFKGLSGIENITVEQMEVTDGISSLQLINKVLSNSQTTINMTYTEKSGGLFTKVHELFLKGIKDPRSEVKTYHGLIEAGLLEGGFENEIFTLMYFVTDNTATQIERAFLCCCGQLTEAPFEIYSTEKGNYENKEITVSMSTFVIENSAITAKAKETLEFMRSKNNPNRWNFNSEDFGWKGIEEINPQKADF